MTHKILIITLLSQSFLCIGMNKSELALTLQDLRTYGADVQNNCRTFAQKTNSSFDQEYIKQKQQNLKPAKKQNIGYQNPIKIEQIKMLKKAIQQATEENPIDITVLFPEKKVEMLEDFYSYLIRHTADRGNVILHLKDDERDFYLLLIANMYIDEQKNILKKAQKNNTLYYYSPNSSQTKDSQLLIKQQKANLSVRLTKEQMVELNNSQKNISTQSETNLTKNELSTKPKKESNIVQLSDEAIQQVGFFYVPSNKDEYIKYDNRENMKQHSKMLADEHRLTQLTPFQIRKKSTQQHDKFLHRRSDSSKKKNIDTKTSFEKVRVSAEKPRIEQLSDEPNDDCDNCRKCCLISTAYLTGITGISLILSGLYDGLQMMTR